MDTSEIEHALDLLGIRPPFGLGLVFEADDVLESDWTSYPWNPPPGRRARDRRASPKPEWGALVAVAEIRRRDSRRAAGVAALRRITELMISGIYVPPPADPLHARNDEETQLRAEVHYRLAAPAADLVDKDTRAAALRAQYQTIATAFRRARNLDALAAFDIRGAIVARPGPALDRRLRTLQV